MKKVVLLLFSSVIMFADTIGGEISLGFYGHSLEGTSRYKADNTADFVDTLGFSSTEDIFFKAYIEHPFPVVPNIKLAYHTLTHAGERILSSFSWGGMENVTGKVDSGLSLDYTDVTLYYEILDNWIAVDGGLTFRSLKGDMKLETAIKSDSLSYSETLPLLYGKARFYIPSTDISLQAEMNLLALGSISSYDVELSARYTFDLGLGLELGYKSFYLESDTLVAGLRTELNFAGPYAAAVWDF